MAIQQALLSVSDKTGIIEFAQGLHTRGVKLLSTGQALLSVSDKTGIIEFAQGLHTRGVKLLSTGG
ncbi:hypothetical protein [[Haemophilus] ducreyi]|uniref:hypothetical protein n=1 Tax=Haemophilus ducreyi TaxID=730 RepID=UPI000A64DC61